ncbi:MAG TPA: superoxide dismutase family protein [Bdellovibrionales bacterium]|nr:superoxide dismutase family protein [Bdellovibrionales bacterium]
MLALTLLTFTAHAALSDAKAQLKNAKGQTLGSATLTAMKKGVRLIVEAEKLPPGELAIHFHENGKCEGPKFESAGSHFAGAAKSHGFDSDGGPHAGDMPNLIVPATGKVRAELINTAVTMGKESNSLFKAGGTSLVIHAKADDYKSQPSGNAGDRLLCGVILPL